MKALPLIASLPFLFLIGCGNPADKVPEASVRPASTNRAGTAGTGSAEGKFYAFSSKDSSIEFIGSKVTGSHKGGFKNFVGEFKIVDGKVAESGNRLVIETSSLWSDNDRLTGHLKNPDFFDAAKYPTTTFVTTAVKQEGTNTTVTGDLTLHGITKSITFPAKVEVANDQVTVNSEFFLNRFDFEMKYPGKADDLIRKEVVLRLNLKATPGRAPFETIDGAKVAALEAARP